MSQTLTDREWQTTKYRANHWVVTLTNGVKADSRNKRTTCVKHKITGLYCGKWYVPPYDYNPCYSPHVVTRKYISYAKYLLLLMYCDIFLFKYIFGSRYFPPQVCTWKYMDQNICYRWYVGRLLFKYIFGSRYVPPLSPHHSPQVGTRRGRRVRTQQEDGQSWPMPRHLKLDFLNTSKYSQIQAWTTYTNTNTIDSINMWRADKCQAIWNWIFQMRAKRAKYSQIQANTAKYS